ncbi:MAG: PEP-CTERM sorting domain-containing protein [Phycisphaerae bacterium]|nr:PEP-CTERM sorting domain-containing protein [Phycisphaerae bacterium]
MCKQLRLGSVCALLTIAVTLSGIASPTAAEDVYFPDANLETALRWEPGIPDSGPITDTDMKTLYWFSASCLGISNIQGLEYGTNLLELELHDSLISDISAVSGLTNLTLLGMNANQISDISAVSGLTNLAELYLDSNQVEIMNLSNSNLSSLENFNIQFNPLTSVLLVNATLSQAVFDVLMNGGTGEWDFGIAELTDTGVLNLDMSGVDFVGISDLSSMHMMDDLETLSLAGATNLAGSQVVALTNELDSLNDLDVAGLWDSFDAETQDELNAWDAGEGNNLVVTPEPATLSLLALGGLALLRRKRK